MKTKFKISQFSRFLLRFGYVILVKIWKWLKLPNSVPFIKKTLVNHVYIRIWSSWLTFTVLQWMKWNFKLSQFSRFLLRGSWVWRSSGAVMCQWALRCWAVWPSMTQVSTPIIMATIWQLCYRGRSHSFPELSKIRDQQNQPEDNGIERPKRMRSPQ